MDPQAAWDQLLAAYDRLDWATVEERATGLLEWLDRGGFPLRIVGPHAAGQEWNRRVVHHACKLARDDARRYSQAECPF